MLSVDTSITECNLFNVNLKFWLGLIRFRFQEESHLVSVTLLILVYLVLGGLPSLTFVAF